MSIQIAVLDDWQNVASDVVDWSALDSVGKVHFLHDYPADTATMIERLKGFEVICLMRERSTFDKALLQKVPSRLCAQVLCEGKPTDADMQTVLHTLKQVLESNGMPITYYDITLVPTGDYADHSAFMADVLESGLTSADTIA